MKKLMKNILCVCLVFCLAFAITACGNGGGSSEEKAVAKYVEVNEADVEAAASSNVVTCNMTANGTEVEYTYTLHNVSGYTAEHADDVEKSFEEELRYKEAEIYRMLSDMQSEEPNISAIVFMYIDSDGNQLFKKTYY